MAVKSFGRLLIAATVVVAAVAVAEQYDMRIAWLFAVATVLALYFNNPRIAGEIRQLIGV